jgi:hypothetical protein
VTANHAEGLMDTAYRSTELSQHNVRMDTFDLAMARNKDESRNYRTPNMFNKKMYLLVILYSWYTVCLYHINDFNMK